MTLGGPTSSPVRPSGHALAAGLLAAYSGDTERVLALLEEGLAVVEARHLDELAGPRDGSSRAEQATRDPLIRPGTRTLVDLTGAGHARPQA